MAGLNRRTRLRYWACIGIIDTTLILCYPNELPVYSCFLKTVRGPGDDSITLATKFEMIFIASCHVVPACKILLTELFLPILFKQLMTCWALISAFDQLNLIQ